MTWPGAFKMTKLNLKRIVVVIALIALTGWLILRHAPVYLPTLPNAEMAVPEGPHAVFGYATLANPLVRYVVIGRHAPSRAAELEGFLRVGRDLVPAPDAVVSGRVFVVDARGLGRLDRYEELGRRYDRRLKQLADGTDAWVYRLIEQAPSE